jgi:peptide/nickel transport system substrate-binding protein
MKPESKIASFFNALFVEFRELGIIGKIERVVQKMNPSEKILFSVVAFVCMISGLTLLIRVSNSFLVEVPAYGGSFTEGVVGTPRFINPILAISDSDKDIVSLVYAGLLRTNEQGLIVPDLAESYTVSEDGREYDIFINSNAHFHDGKPVTADDVVFTIQKILDPIIKSPRHSNWIGVTTEKIDTNQIKIILEKPYAPFLEALTVGILPKHIWEKVSAEEFPFSNFNITPIGAGPYKIKNIDRNSGGVLTSLSLTSFHGYVLGRPKIDGISFRFFQNETELSQAYKNGSIESASGISSQLTTSIDNNFLIEQVLLPRVFGVFFNQNIAPVFLNPEVRQALDLATPKKRIVDEVLLGFGKTLNGPTPLNQEVNSGYDIERAKSLLTENGWVMNENGVLEKKTKTGTTLLSFALTTSDAPELKSTANILKEAWQQLGAQVDIKIFESADLSQTIIKNRKYDALLFGEIVSDTSDLYPFWHSSARNDPGLNISLYANITTDKALEKLREISNPQEKSEQREIVISEIKKDNPAIFLFSPKLIYLKPKKVKNVLLKPVSTQNERFLTIKDWFIETDKVWEIFVKNNIE